MRIKSVVRIDWDAARANAWMPLLMIGAAAIPVVVGASALVSQAAVAAACAVIVFSGMEAVRRRYLLVGSVFLAALVFVATGGVWATTLDVVTVVVAVVALAEFAHNTRKRAAGSAA